MQRHGTRAARRCWSVPRLAAQTPRRCPRLNSNLRSFSLHLSWHSESSALSLIHPMRSASEASERFSMPLRSLVLEMA